MNLVLKLKGLLATTVIMAGLGVGLVVPAKQVFAEDIINPVCNTVRPGSESPTLCEENKPEDLNSNRIFGPNGIITRAAKLLTLVVGIASVVVIIISGVQYVISSGDPTRLNRAKDTLIYALIGLVIALLAQAIIVFVLNRI